MTRSRHSFFQVSAPRIVNFTVIALMIGVLYTMSLPKNTAQETAPATAAETVPDGTSEAVKTPAAEAAKPAEEKPPVEADMESTPTGDDPLRETFQPVAEGTQTAPETFQPVAEDSTARETSLEAKKAAEEAARKAEERKQLLENLKIWTIFLVIVIACFATGNYFAKYWRLPDHNVRIFVLLLAFFGSAAAVYLGSNRLTLGIDLQGGVVLVYDVKASARSEAGADGPQSGSSGLTTQVMEQLITAIGNRVNPGGVREIAITRLGSQQVQVIIPKAEDAEVDRIQRIISESGALTFRILASTLYPQDNDIIERAKREPGREIRTADGRLLAQWTPVFPKEEDGFRHNPDIITRERRGQFEVLVLYNDGFDVTGKYLSLVQPGNDGGQAGVSFEFDSIGENKFKRLTSANQPDPVQARLKRQLGIILNDSLYSAPSINAVIGKRGIITFGRRHTEEERRQLRQDIEDLINVLNAGALPADLSKEPVSRQLIGATLGTDTIQKGKVALIASAAVVLLFMIFYYRLAGLIACFCVITNLLMLVAIMLALRAAFTLPGLAGLVLTIGMAVDANILIYERLREELQAGSSLKMAIRNAYAKALSAIVDSNITTIITGVILYWVGTEQVKGFAVTLVLGVSLSMFTAIYCARTIMDIFEAQRSIKTFRMMQLFKRPNINFLGARVACMTISIVVMVIGVAAVVARGTSIFDIDFVGGVSAEVVFHESQDIGQIRSALYEKDKTIDDIGKRLNDLAVQNVQASGEGGSISNLTQAKPIENTRFIITTSIPQVRDREISPDEYLQTVRNILKETFGDKLVYSRLDYSVENGGKEGEIDIRLKFFPAINYESLRSTIKAATDKAIAAKLVENDFAYTPSTDGYYEGSRQSFTEWTINAQTTKEVVDKILGPLKSELDNTPYFPTSTTVGGSVAKDTRMAGLLAVAFSLICILLYIWFRFSRLVYGLAAVIGLLHDVLIVLGLIALSAWLATPLSFLQINEFKIGLPVVAAFLTIIGYSLNDTIILFDRIRENRGKSPVLTGKMINDSINQTLSRTVLTSLTTFFVAIILYFWGGQGIHTFAFAMSAGVAIGTYSTIGLCAPLLFWMTGAEDTTKRDEIAEK